MRHLINNNVNIVTVWVKAHLIFFGKFRFPYWHFCNLHPFEPEKKRRFCHITIIRSLRQHPYITRHKYNVFTMALDVIIQRGPFLSYRFIHKRRWPPACDSTLDGKACRFWGPVMSSLDDVTQSQTDWAGVWIGRCYVSFGRRFDFHSTCGFSIFGTLRPVPHPCRETEL